VRERQVSGAAHGFLAGGGEMGALLRGGEWAATPLGDAAGWPAAIKTALSICLGSASPMAVWAGHSVAELRHFYNDAYRPVLGTAKHPRALGATGPEVWPEIWDVLGPVLGEVLERGEPVRREDEHFVLDRDGFREDTWFIHSHSPVREVDGTVVGVLTIAIEVTERVLAARRAEALLSLEATLRDLDDPDEMLAAATAVMGRELRLDRCGYAEVAPSGTVLTIRRDWTAGRLPSLAGELPLADIGQDLVDEYRAGRAVRLEDRWQDARTRGLRNAFSREGARAGLAVPLLKEGRLVAVTYAHSAEPRRWTGADEAFVRDMAECIWAAVERARADQARRLAQAALVESEERLRLVARAAGIGTWDFDPRTRTGRWDTAATLAGGLDPDDPHYDGESWLRLVHPDDRERVSAAFFASLLPSGPAYDLEFRGAQPAADGGTRWLSSQGTVLRAGAGGAALRAVGIMRDVTARRRAEEQLRESEARLRLAVDGAGAASWDMDLVTGEGFWSERHFDMFGLPRAPGGRATQALWRARIHPDDLPMVVGALGSSLDAGEPHRAEYRILRADTGEVRRMLCYGQVIRGGDNGPPRSIGVMFDVTEDRAAEAALRRLNEELEARVREEVAAREAAQGQLAHAQRMEALGQLAGGIAHDFNNVMQAVAGGAGLIRRRARDPQMVDHLARMVEESARRGASITRRLLAFARRDELRAEPVACEPLLDDMREVLAHTLGRSVEVRTEVAAPDGRLPPLMADRGQLETVLINLATNARDAMQEGGTLTISAEVDQLHTPRAAGPGLPIGRYIRISVTDTGCGMTPEVVSRATEPFFTTKERGRGTGLGLPMARGFAEQSGGALVIRSTPGLGTTVALWLPVAPHPEIPVLPCGEGQRMTLLATILVVDDEDLVREVVAAGLEEHGHVVLRAPDGAAALAMVDAGARVDLVLSDYTMPGLDGLSLIREIRRRRPEVPALLLTGNAGDDAQAAAVVMGGVAGGEFSLVRKPVTADEVAARVAALLRAAQPGGRSQPITSAADRSGGKTG
jgi:PAS domain S-box-containing protein